MTKQFKVLLVFPKKKWRTQDRRVKNFSEYLSLKENYGKIYGDIKIDTLNIDLPDIKLNKHHIYNEKEIKKITEQYRDDYTIIGIVFPYTRGEKYGGNYYPNTDATDHKMDFYIKANERSKHTRRGQRVYDFEEFLEHEISHAVALDVGLKGQYAGLGYVEGADNTHYYFYMKEDKLDEWYAEINKQFDKKRTYIQTIINASQSVIDILKKKELNGKIKVVGFDKELADKAQTMVEVMSLLGKEIRITESFRSAGRQNALYAQGRTIAGNIVTNAKGGESYHNYGLAFDIVFREKGYNAPESDWQLVGAIGKALGLNWGGDWKGFVDKPHFEVNMTLKEIKEKYII